MANLLLIGFTETNANVIQIFIEMTFKDIYVDTIIRHLNDSPLSLPVLTEEHHKMTFLLDLFQTLIVIWYNTDFRKTDKA